MGEMPGLTIDMHKLDGIAARALEFALPYASRSGEARGARRAETAPQAQALIIPAERMKAGREHRIPLSREAIRPPKSLPRVEGSDLGFPALRGAELSDMSLTAPRTG